MHYGLLILDRDQPVRSQVDVIEACRHVNFYQNTNFYASFSHNKLYNTCNKMVLELKNVIISPGFTEKITLLNAANDSPFVIDEKSSDAICKQNTRNLVGNSLMP